MEWRLRPGSDTLSSNRKRIFATPFCAIVWLMAAAAPASAQTAESLPHVKKVFVDSLGQGRRADEVRSQVVRRLQKNHVFEVVPNRANADAAIRGTAQIWTVSQASLSPHSHGATETIYEGFLSVEMIGRNQQTLWSYLATPSRFSWSGVAGDLAGQVVSKLLLDVQGGAHSNEPSASPATAGAGATLKAAGATFPAPLYKKWFQSFEQEHSEVHISYEAVGSGEGIRRLGDGQIDFGASEMPLSDQAMSDLHRKFVHVPIVLGAVVPIFNVPGLQHKVNFTSEVLAGIYLGKIRKWSDAEVRKANPGMRLPDADIVVVHRSDGSGTSFVWSDYLSKVSTEWKAAVGAGATLQWPVGIGAEYNDGVASTVQQTPNSIGYVELIYAIQHELEFGAVKNAAGQFVRADIASVTEAARSASERERDLRVSITDPPGKTAYPIATYTWLLVPEQSDDKYKRGALLELLRWVLTSGQKSCSALGYSPLPTEVAERGLDTVNRALARTASQVQAERDNWISRGSTLPTGPAPGIPNSK